MSGTITISLTQRLDNSTHLPLSGGLMYFIQAGTTSTPQNAYQDSALTIPYANPLTLDSGGNIPQLFFADGAIKVRITNRLGVQQLVQDNIQVTGASSGSGGGGTVDPTTILATGDIKARYGTGILTGFVRANGRTIGSATSGATERANADAQALFEYLWGADANLAVSTGRGVSANADWVATKTLTLPDGRGRNLTGLADMGASTSSILNGVTFNSPGTSTTLGATGGASFTTILTANQPAYTPSGSLSLSTPVSTSVTTTVTGTASVTAANWVASSTSDSTGVNPPAGGGGSGLASSLTGGLISKIVSSGAISASASSPASSTATPTGSFTGVAQGGISTPMQTVSPLLLITTYIKL